MEQYNKFKGTKYSLIENFLLVGIPQILILKILLVGTILEFTLDL